jgi:hypothetical protein
MVTIGQRWEAVDGVTWTIAQVWRKDGLVLLAHGHDRQPVLFAELAERYEPAEREG